MEIMKFSKSKKKIVNILHW